MPRAPGADVSVGEDTNILSYQDAESIAAYAVPAMQWAAGSGVLSGHLRLHPLSQGNRHPCTDGGDSVRFASQTASK